MSENKVAIQEKNITDGVLSRIKDMEGKGDITFPKNYSYSNALKSAYLILAETVDKDKKPVLQNCSQASICNALLDMCIQGLSPAKKQCYFIPYGGKLQLSKSYLGNIAATKRLKGVKNVFANAIYQDDVFAYELDLSTGLKKITKHEQSFENIDVAKIKGAYAIVVMEDGNNYIEVMSITQIRESWKMGSAYRYSTKEKPSVHDKFTDEMVKKTVINRACKNFTCTSDDSDLLVETISRTNEYIPEDIVENVHEEVKEEIKEHANKEVIDIPEEEVNEVQKEEVRKEEIINGQRSFTDGPGF